MAPQPKRKHTRSRSNKRAFVNQKITLGSLAKCKECGKLREPHKACPSCGYYGK